MSSLRSYNYYPYGQHFTEGAQAAYSAQRWKFGDKEFDAEKGLNWHDFGARFLMPQFGLFTTQDPLRHRNWHLSPYLYCAANPIRFIDPTGMDWMKATYGNETFYLYHKDVHNQDGVKNIYGSSAQLEYLSSDINIDFKRDDGSLISKFSLTSDGKIFQNETEISEYDYGGLHIGNQANISYFGGHEYDYKKEKGGSNWGHTHYLGPNNPKNILGNDTYAIAPLNKQDYNAYLHDKDYDRLGAVGILGVLSRLTNKADVSLMKRSLYNSYHSYTTVESLMSLATFYAFYYGYLYKNLYLW